MEPAHSRCSSKPRWLSSLILSAQGVGVQITAHPQLPETLLPPARWLKSGRLCPEMQGDRLSAGSPRSFQDGGGPALLPPQLQREKAQKSPAAASLPGTVRKKFSGNPSGLLHSSSTIKDHFKGPLPPRKAVPTMSPVYTASEHTAEAENGEKTEEAAASPSGQPPISDFSIATDSSAEFDLTLKPVMASI